MAVSHLDRARYPAARRKQGPMHVRRVSHELEIWAPAKLNLFLEVLGRREDGYHEIESLMCPVDVYDTLTFHPTDGRAIELATEDAGCRDPLPPPEENLVHRALELLRRRFGLVQGARLRLIKRIPISSGLAGGSSDAAAALVAGNLGWRLGLSREALVPLAAELGSDVAFFLNGSWAMARGRGERLEAVAGLGRVHYVIVRPPVGLSTASVYRACRPANPPRSAAPLLAALRQGDLGGAGRALHNGLEEAAAGLCEWIGRLRGLFSRLDVAGHQMSGSGTSYFGLCRTRGQAMAIAGRLRALCVGRVFAVQSCL